MATLEGGASGKKVNITDDNREDVSSRSNPRIYYISRDDRAAYSWTADTYDYTAADTILLVKNTSSTKDLVVQSIWFSGDTTMQVTVHRPTAEVTSPTGTAITETRLHGQAADAEATAIRDETTNSIGSVIWQGRVIADTTMILDLAESLRLDSNESIAVDFVTEGTACNVTILGFFETGR